MLRVLKKHGCPDNLVDSPRTSAKKKKDQDPFAEGEGLNDRLKELEIKDDE